MEETVDFRKTHYKINGRYFHFRSEYKEMQKKKIETDGFGEQTAHFTKPSRGQRCLMNGLLRRCIVTNQRCFLGKHE